jgi:7-carboxy-7-deazaguanine synthase
MNISEIYASRQGEGLLTGTPSSFVRVAGCNLRCWFCDTPYASWNPEGEDRSVEEVVEAVQSHTLEHVVITGGEPMLFAELIPLTQQLHRLGKHITIETAGTLLLPVACDLMSISPKLGNSDPSPEQAGKWRQRHQRDRFRPDVLLQLLSQYVCQLKFVVESPADLADIDAFVARFDFLQASQIWLMPQGTEATSLEQKELWLNELCQTRGWRLCSRQHIEWYGFQRGV